MCAPGACDHRWPFPHREQSQHWRRVKGARPRPRCLSSCLHGRMQLQQARIPVTGHEQADGQHAGADWRCGGRRVRAGRSWPPLVCLPFFPHCAAVAVPRTSGVASIVAVVADVIAVDARRRKKLWEVPAPGNYVDRRDFGSAHFYIQWYSSLPIAKRLKSHGELLEKIFFSFL